MLHTLEVLNEVTPQIFQAILDLKINSSERRSVSIENLQAMASNTLVDLIVIRDEVDTIVGAITLAGYPTVKGPKFWIEDVNVREDQQGKGLGSALIRAALKNAKERGATKVYLSSNPRREAANRLYQRLGFQHYETNTYRFDLPRD